MSLCLSVCLSHAGIVSNQLNLSNRVMVVTSFRNSDKVTANEGVKYRRSLAVFVVSCISETMQDRVIVTIGH